MPRLLKPHNFLLKMIFFGFQGNMQKREDFIKFQSYIIFEHSITLKKVIFVFIKSILYLLDYTEIETSNRPD